MTKKKPLWLWIAVISVACILLDVVGYYVLSNNIEQRMFDTLKRDLDITLAAVNPDRVESVAQTHSDTSEDFYRLQTQFFALEDQFVTDGIDSVYSMEKRGEEILFLVDSTPVGDPEYGPPGDKYLNPPQELYSVFLNGQPASVGPYSDEYGEFYSYFRPIRRFSDNVIVGAMGIDIRTDYYHQQFWQEFISYFGVVLAFYILSIALLIYVRKAARSRKELLEEKKMAEDLVNVLPDMFYLLDSSGKFLLWNKTFTKTLGLKNEEIPNITFFSLFSDEDRRKMEESIDKVRDKGHDIIEATIKDKDGQPILFEFYHTILTGLENQIIGTAGNGHDISLRYKREIELAKQKEELENLNRVMLGREAKMTELKTEIAELREALDKQKNSK